MRLSKYAFMAAGCALMASCSSDTPDNPVNEQTVSGYAQIEIKLPTVSGTRDMTDTSFEQGTPDEYAVKNGKIIVFKTAAGGEGNATWVCTADLSGLNFGTGADGEITTTSTSVAKLSDINLSDDSQYAAIVVLNYNDNFKFPVPAATLTAWSEAAQANDMKLIADGKTYLTMSNAANYKAEGPVLLVNLDKSKISQTESGATASAATFHVQRAVSKVTVVTKDSYDVNSASYAGDKVEITDWNLDITNKTTYPVQVTNGLATDFAAIWSTDRFFGGSSFKRALWSKDPNYSKDITTQAAIEAEFNVVKSVSGKPAAVYCLENTFDVNRMKQGQTTRVLIKAVYTPKGMTKGDSFIKIGSNTKLWKVADAQAEIEARAKTMLNSADVTVEMGNVATTAGNYSLKNVKIQKSGADITDEQYTAIANTLGLKSANDAEISTYNKGEVYYVSRIKHFGDEDCPWKLGDPTYANDNAKYLGRYGMIRNFWYEVDVKNVSTLGTPTVPTIKPDEWDDESAYYIQTTINVLAWAKKTLNTDL